MDVQVLTIVLRLIHIIGGVFWVGAVLVVAGFLYPASQSPEGRGIMPLVMFRHKLGIWLGIASGLTMLSGFVMYGRVAMSAPGWARSRPAMALGLGGVLAIVASVIGGAVVSRAIERLGALGAQMQAGGNAAEIAPEMSRLQRRVTTGTRIVAGLLVIVVATMAIARYL
jgi:hypothetical protein